jgi:hypothetical protein
LPDRRWNPVYVGNPLDYAALFTPSLKQKHRAAKVQKISDHEIKLQWTNLMSENGGALPVTLTASVTLKTLPWFCSPSPL